MDSSQTLGERVNYIARRYAYLGLKATASVMHERDRSTLAFIVARADAAERLANAVAAMAGLEETWGECDCRCDGCIERKAALAAWREVTDG